MKHVSALNNYVLLHSRNLLWHTHNTIQCRVCLYLGTELLLEACCKNNVEIFIHCSTIDVIQGFENITNGNEDNIKPDKLLFGSYARSKRAGENAVLKMNGRQLPNGKCHLYFLDLCKKCIIWATTEIWSSLRNQQDSIGLY